ncbi:MAG: PGPGW domain-containing protein [Mariprofundus sp.]|nr:PGPGW domain-containing protein [Mariprofundus sp.]
MQMFVVRIPVDYFSHHKRHAISDETHHPVVALMLSWLKNLLGIFLILAGIIMLFTPGQGLLSILFGLMVMNYPGKYRLECSIINRPLIINTINVMRKKKGYPPLQAPQSKPTLCS